MNREKIPLRRHRTTPNLPQPMPAAVKRGLRISIYQLRQLTPMLTVIRPRLLVAPPPPQHHRHLHHQLKWSPRHPTDRIPHHRLRNTRPRPIPALQHQLRPRTTITTAPGGSPSRAMYVERGQVVPLLIRVGDG